MRHRFIVNSRFRRELGCPSVFTACPFQRRGSSSLPVQTLSSHLVSFLRHPTQPPLSPFLPYPPLSPLPLPSRLTITTTCILLLLLLLFVVERRTIMHQLAHGHCNVLLPQPLTTAPPTLCTTCAIRSRSRASPRSLISSIGASAFGTRCVDMCCVCDDWSPNRKSK